MGIRSCWEKIRRQNEANGEYGKQTKKVKRPKI
jgi:hypothetical protein